MSSSEQPARSGALLALILVALFLATLGLRMRGIDWMLPCLVEPDVHLAVQLEDFRAGREVPAGDTDHGKYPHLLSRVLQPLPPLFDPSGNVGRSSVTHDTDHLGRAKGAILQVRHLVALLASALVPLTFLLASRFMQTRWALLAAVFVAFAPLHQHFAQQARPHAASATFVLLAVLASLRIPGRATALSYALAGGAAALAVGSLHSGVAVLLPLAVAHFLVPEQRKPLKWLLGPAVALVPVVIAVITCYPFLFEGSGAGRSLFDWSGGGVTQSAHAVSWSNFNGAGFLRVAGFLWSYEPAAAILAALGLVAWGLRGRAALDLGPHKAELVILASYMLPYLFVIGLYALTFQRFVLALLPFLACGAAFAVARLASALEGTRLPAAARTMILAMLLGAALAWPVSVTLRLGTLRSHPDTLAQAASWIAANVTPAGPRVLVSPGIDLPLPRTADAAAQDANLPHGIRPEPWIDYQAMMLAHQGPLYPLFGSGYPVYRVPVHGPREIARLNRKPREWLEELGAEYLVVPYVEKKRNLVAWLLREQALRSGERVARFSAEPDLDLSIFPFMYTEAPIQDPMHFGRRTLRVDAVGPTVEIYRLKRVTED